MENGDDKLPLIVKEDKRQRFTSFNRRSYEVYSSYNEFIQVSDPTKREPERIKSLSFKRRRISVCVEGKRNASDSDLRNRSQGIQVRLVRSQPDLCTGCKLSITHNDNLVIQLHENLYHVYCFQCTQCGNKINPKADYILIENGKPLCGSCIPECRACGETILSNHVHVIDKDFHEKCLLCTFCRKKLSSKAYAREGELCCAKCIIPVFNEEWSHLSSPDRTSPSNSTSSICGKATTMPPTSPTSEKDVVIKIGRRTVTLNPKMLSLSKNIFTITKSTLDRSRSKSPLHPAARLNSLIKPSFEMPTSVCDDKLGISSLSCILYDEVGSTLLLSFCVADNSVEWVVFWLDVEHFKHFDGSRDDLKLLANCILLKYMVDMAEIPVELPTGMMEKITEDVELNIRQDVFNEAQQFVYAKMEELIWDRFLRSEDGQNYLEILVARDIQRKQRLESADGFAGKNITAIVKAFDKRHSSTKYYVYEIAVEVGLDHFIIYRRYSEFYRLHQELRTVYHSLRFPPFPKKIIFGRSQIRNVADKRMVELQTYLQGILSFPEITAGCCLHEFLRQTEDDKENEAFSKRIFSS